VGTKCSHWLSWVGPWWWNPADFSSSLLLLEMLIIHSERSSTCSLYSDDQVSESIQISEFEHKVIV